MPVRSDAAAAAAAAEAARRAAEAARRAAAAQAQAQARAAAAQKKPPVAVKDGFSADRPTGTADGTAADGAPKTPETREELVARFPELKGASKEKAEKVIDAMKKLATGSPSEKFSALAALAKDFPDNLGGALDKLGIKDTTLGKIAANKDALSALSTLTDPKTGKADKAAAALDFAKELGGVLKPDDLKGALSTALNGLDSGSKLITAISTWADPEKTGVEKAKATLDLGKSLIEFAGKESPQLGNKLRTLDGPLKAAGAAITLLDPKAELQDKIDAGLQLASSLPGLKDDLKGLKELFVNAGVKDAAKVSEGVAQAAQTAIKGLEPALARKLTGAELEQLKTLGAKVGEDELAKVLAGVGDKEALGVLTSQLSKLDAAAGKQLLSTLGELEHGVLQKALKDPALTESLVKMAGKLDEDGAKVMGKILKEFDHEGLKTLTKFADKLEGPALKDALKLMEPIAEHGGSKLAGQALKGLDKALSKFGVKLTEKSAAKALGALAKCIPLAGAIPNAIDAVKYGKEAVELRDKNKDLGMFAANMAKLNVLDGAAGVAMDLTGVGVAADVAVSVALGATELAGDIAFDAEKEKLLADPAHYQAPDWMKAVNIGVAAVTLPSGPLELAAYYGPEGAAQLTQWGIEKSVNGAVDLAKAVGVSQAEAVGDAGKLTGQFLHQLADVVRNPTKYGKAVADNAREVFNKALEAGGKLADEAKTVIKGAVDSAVAAGAKGLETLKWIAQNPGPAAKLALDGINSLVDKGLQLGTDAGKALYKGAVETLASLQKGWEGLKGAAKEKAKELIDSAKAGLSSAIDKAKELGQKGADLVVWAATHPGDVGRMAKQAVNELLAKGGEVAKAAWDNIRALGNKGLDLAQSAITSLKNAGEAAVDTLKYVAQNPGEAATKVRDWVGKTLTGMVDAGGAAAKKAAGAIKDFIDARADWAVKYGKELLQRGSAAFKEVAKAWATNLTEGGKAVLDGLKDLGDAGLDALKDLAQLGGQVAGYAVDKLTDLAKAGYSKAKDVIGSLADAGISAAKEAASTVKGWTDGEFSVGGYKIDLNPLW